MQIKFACALLPAKYDNCSHTLRGTSMIYIMALSIHTGVAGGSWYNHPGGGANYLCLTREPQWGNFSAGAEAARGLLYGAQYHDLDSVYPGKGLWDNDVPCAVCRPRHRSTVMMIPGRFQCPAGWTREYPGYLMAERYSHKCMILTLFAK